MDLPQAQSSSILSARVSSYSIHFAIYCTNSTIYLAFTIKKTTKINTITIFNTVIERERKRCRNTHKFDKFKYRYVDRAISKWLCKSERKKNMEKYNSGLCDNKNQWGYLLAAEFWNIFLPPKKGLCICVSIMVLVFSMLHVCNATTFTGLANGLRCIHYHK